MISESSPIRRRKLSDDVEDRLLLLIQNNGLRPGDLLPSERELMSEYRVGRPAIREAMQHLQRMGLVEIRHGERPRVAEPSMDVMAEQMSQTMRHLLTHSAATMQHLKQARFVFEAEMARTAARHRSADDVEDLRRILARQKAVREDASRFLQCDGEFHRRIAAISGNPIFESLAQSLFSWLAHFHIDMVRMAGREKATLAEHAAIVDAIAAGDVEGAGHRMSDHLNRANSLYRRDDPQSRHT